jgi:hypothetical protein
MQHRTLSRPPIKQRRSLLMLLGLQLMLIGGCTPAPEALFDDYQQRLARILPLPQLEATTVAIEGRAPLPAVRDVFQQLPDIRLDMLDLIAIRDCGLQSLVAHRNSSLGKVMSTANQLGYELEVIQQLQPCLTHPSLDLKLQQQLQDFYQQKLTALPKALNNLLLTDQTLRQQLQGSQRWLALGAAHTTTDTLFALQQLLKLKQQALAISHFADATNAQLAPAAEPNRLQTADINQALALLYQGQLLADLQYSMRQSNSQLQQLNQRLATVDLTNWCVKAQRNGQSDILNNVFGQIYLGRVQPYLAQLDSINHQLLPLLTLLYQDSPFEGLVAKRLSAPADELRQHLGAHVRWWQQVQRQCQLQLMPRPGSKNS